MLPHGPVLYSISKKNYSYLRISHVMVGGGGLCGLEPCLYSGSAHKIEYLIEYYLNVNDLNLNLYY